MANIPAAILTITAAIIISAFIVNQAQALDCGIERNDNTGLRDAITKCLATNRTMLDNIRDMMSSFESSSSSADSSIESNSSEEEDSSTTTTTSNIGRPKRATHPLETTTSSATSETTTDHAEESSTGSGISVSCLARCIFDNLGLVDANGYPDHKKIVDGLLKTVSGREVKDFFQDTVDQCIQDVDNKGNHVDDACLYSSKLVTCIAERGRLNCDDWPVGNLPFQS